MSADSLLLDSNIIVHVFQGHRALAEQLEGKVLCISVVTRMELYAWPGRDGGRTAWLDEFLKECVLFELDRSIQDLTIDLKKRFKLPLADTIIAATAIQKDLPLLTADKDFKRFDAVAKIILIEP